MNLIASRAISIALFGGLVAFLSLGPAAGYGPQILAVFIAWASYYHFNRKLEGLKKSLITNLFGAAWGAVAVAFLSQQERFGAGVHFPAWAAIGVVITLAALVLATRLSLFDDIAGLLLGYVAMAGTALQSAKLDIILSPSLENPVISVALSLIVGAALAYVADMIAEALAKFASTRGSRAKPAIAA